MGIEIMILGGRTIMRRTTDHDLLKGDIVGGSNPPREKD